MGAPASADRSRRKLSLGKKKSHIFRLFVFTSHDRQEYDDIASRWMRVGYRPARERAEKGTERAEVVVMVEDEVEVL